MALLVIPLLTVVGISGSHQSARPAGFLADVEWSGAVLQIDPRKLTIAVDINTIAGSYCFDSGLPDLRPVVSETATKVSIRARAFRPSNPSPTQSVPAGAVLACSGRGYRPVTVTVQLEQPLGTRSLLDAKTGTRHPVFEAGTLPTPSWLPAGYVDRIIRWQDDSPQGGVMQEYDGPDGLLRVGRGPESPTTSSDKVLTTAKVLGHPAKVFTYNAAPNVICVVWNDSEYWWSICSVGANPPRASLSAKELLRIANSMR
ncbi:MAG TPA: hypothetical protein VF557_14025 [Jatrophihabitans sp.]|uniref:hypothetical protein n=1 Tax=Jatrophihabitans sp. TaxID=1932789 RepID=UPI002F0499DE